MQLINKGLVILTLIYSVTITIDTFLKTSIYEKYLSSESLHNGIVWGLLVMLIVQIVWLVKGYFFSSKWFLYAMILNVLLFVVQCLYFIKNGDL